MYNKILKMEAKEEKVCHRVLYFGKCSTNPQSLCQHYHVKATLECIKIGLFNVPQT